MADRFKLTKFTHLIPLAIFPIVQSSILNTFEIVMSEDAMLVGLLVPDPMVNSFDIYAMAPTRGKRKKTKFIYLKLGEVTDKNIGTCLGAFTIPLGTFFLFQIDDDD